MKKRVKQKHLGFTLVELLVVIAIISVLMGLLLPALRGAQNTAQQIACASQQKQIYFIMIDYANDYDDWLPWLGSNKANLEPGNCTTPSLGNWINKLLPYTGQKPGYDNPKELNIANPQRWGRGIFWCPTKGNDLGSGGTRWFGGILLNNYVVGRDAQNLSVSFPARRLASLAKPSRKIFVLDTIDSEFAVGSTTWSLWLVPYWSGAPEKGYATRHHGGGNYVWGDGHLTWNPSEEIQYNRNSYLLP